MKKIYILIVTIVMMYATSHAQEWSSFPVPANAGAGKTWQLQSNISDDFNYVSSEGNRPARFTQKWKAEYHNAWTGPGKTIWNKPQAWSDGDKLAIQAVRVPGTDKVYCGIVTNKTRIQYPVYFEISAKIMNQKLANAFWLLSPDDTQEIDAMEGYGGGAGQEWFAHRMHLSHHVFRRSPFQDYQPMDAGSWHYNAQPWRAAYHRYGCYWRDPWHLEYYIDGQLVRTVSGQNIIDPNGFTGGTGLNKAMDIIIDAENQTDWRPGPTDGELANNNIFWVDWMRIYKPVNGGGGGGSTTQTPFGGNPRAIPGTIQAEDYDNGGEGVAYHDTGNGNNGNVYRNDNVDLQNRDGGVIVGWTANGEWLEYTTNATSGTYKMELRAGTTQSGKKVKVKLGGTTLGTFTVPNTGSWSSFQTVAINNISVSGGNNKVLRLEFEGGLVNINWVRFTAQGGGGGSSSLTIQAENLANTGGTFNDGTVPFGVNVNSNTGINFVNRNDWAEYNVTIPQTGAYQIVYHISSPMTGSTIAFGVSGTTFNTTNVPNNGAWDSYQTLTASNTANFTAGNHTIRLTAGGQDWTWNLDKFVLTRTGPMNTRLGTEEEVQNNAGLGVYPNPANDRLNLTGLSDGMYDVSIYDMQGAKVISQKIDYPNGHSVNVSSLNSGVYLLEVNGNQIDQRLKIVIR